MNKRWTRFEEKSFINEIINKVPMEQISTQHNRSVSALNLRLQKIIYDNIIANKKTMKQLGGVLNMDEEKVRQHYYEYKGFLDKKNTVKSIKIHNKYSDLHDANLSVHEPNLSGGNSPNANSYFDNDKLSSQFKQLETQNSVMKEIIDNLTLKKKIKKLVDNGVVKKNIINKIHL